MSIESKSLQLKICQFYWQLLQVVTVFFLSYVDFLTKDSNPIIIQSCTSQGQSLRRHLRKDIDDRGRHRATVATPMAAVRRVVAHVPDRTRVARVGRGLPLTGARSARTLATGQEDRREASRETDIHPEAELGGPDRGPRTSRRGAGDHARPAAAGVRGHTDTEAERQLTDWAGQRLYIYSDTVI